MAVIGQTLAAKTLEGHTPRSTNENMLLKYECTYKFCQYCNIYLRKKDKLPIGAKQLTNKKTGKHTNRQTN